MRWGEEIRRSQKLQKVGRINIVKIPVLLKVETGEQLALLGGQVQELTVAACGIQEAITATEEVYLKP